MFESLAVLFEQKITLIDWPSEQMRLLARYYDIPPTLVPITRLRRKLLKRIIALRQDDKVFFISLFHSNDTTLKRIRERERERKKERE
jgi:hypothetical protein